jgi:protein ImuB
LPSASGRHAGSAGVGRPLSAIQPDSLLFDLTGCAHLFGGERMLSRQVQRSFGRRGFFIRTAIADTMGAAWAVAHFGRHQTEIVSASQHESVLRLLPVGALRLAGTVIETLAALDVRRIEQLLALPRASLPSRFGPEVILRLDQALGDVSELITPIRPPEPVVAGREFEHPTGDHRTLEVALQQLVEQIVSSLVQRQQGVQRLDVGLKIAGEKRENFGLQISNCGVSAKSDSRKSAIRDPQSTICPRFTINFLRPCQSLSHVMELVLTQLERVVLTEKVAGLQVQAVATALLESRQTQLFAADDDPAAQRELEQLADRMSNRLGKQRVVRSQLRPDPQPEFANRWEPLLGENERGNGGSVSLPVLPCSARPLCLQKEPQAVEVTSLAPAGPPSRFHWKQTLYAVARYWGPERIETGWYRGRHVRRDYYQVETECGLRFWLFWRIGRADWFLHGEFD